jgi:hypothetical protein
MKNFLAIGIATAVKGSADLPRIILALAACAGTALMAAPTVSAQQYNGLYNQITPNYGFGTYTTPGGTINHTQQRVGNTTFDSFNGRGGSVNCTTQRIGSQVFQNCY